MKILSITLSILQAEIKKCKNNTFQIYDFTLKIMHLKFKNVFNILIKYQNIKIPLIKPF